MSVIGFIKRWSKEFDDPYATKLLFTSLVRPNFEYCLESSVSNAHRPYRVRTETIFSFCLTWFELRSKRQVAFLLE